MTWTAFLTHEDTVYYSTHSPIATPESPWTPYTHLIEGVWNHAPDFARMILRNWIQSATPRTPLCDGMLKVMAKRAHTLSSTEFDRECEEAKKLNCIEVKPASIPSLELPWANAGFLAPEDLKNEALKLASLSHIDLESKVRSDRAVGAVLISQDLEILSEAFNQNSTNRTHHAELLLVRRYLENHKQKIPRGSTLLVTLQPCAMCAAQLYTFAEDPDQLQVLFINEDTGPFAQNSVGVRNSHLWKQAGSPRVHFSKFQES